MEAKYGPIAEGNRINQAIYDSFDFLSEKEQKKFVKKFKELPHSEIQIMHTFRELLLGAYLSSTGFLVEYDRKIGGKTPDWSILDPSLKVVAIIEMVYHHIDNKTNDEIVTQCKEGKNVIGYWPNGNDPDHLRLYSHIQDKVSKYKDLVSELNLPYAVSVFLDFLAVIDIQEIKDCLMGGDEPLFKQYPELSGVLHFEDSNHGSYYFEFIKNPYALRKIDIQPGYLMKS
jgi:hypothetical protein